MAAPKHLAKAPENRMMRVRELQDAVLERSMRIVDAAQAFGEIDPEQDDPPADWVRKYGAQEAKERLRVAKYSLMASKDAPVALKIATTVMAGIMKVQAAEKTAPKVFNATVVQMPSSSDGMPRMVIESKVETDDDEA